MEHLYIDKYSEINSFIHRLDPRIKIISFFLFIIFIITTHPLQTLQFFLYFCIISVIILLSKIPVIHFLKNFVNVFPFILLVIIFIPFLNIPNGLLILKNVFVKSFLSILILTTLAATTKFNCLLKGLEKLKIPKIFILILSFMYRYIFVLIEEKMKMERAIRSKYFGRRVFLQFKILGNIIGSLFINTYEKSERIYISMCSRLFNGDIKTVNNLKITSCDILFLTFFLIILTGIKYGTSLF